MTISIAIADDHPLVLGGLEGLLRLESDVSVVARCTNGEEALDAVRRRQPDLLVTDLNMPRMDGMAVLRTIHREGLSTRVILLVAEITKRDALEALRLGVGGVLLKDMAPQMLTRCLRKVHSGQQWFEKRSLDTLVESLLARESGVREASALLTPREMDVARMVASGLRNRELSEQLNVREGTVKLHLHNIYKKLNIQSRVELTLYAQRKGLTDM